MELTWLLIRIQQFFVRFIKGADFIGNFSRRFYFYSVLLILMLARHSRKLSLYFFFNLWWCLMSFSSSILLTINQEIDEYFSTFETFQLSYFSVVILNQSFPILQCLIGNFTNHVTRWSNQVADTNSKSRVISLSARSISNGRWSLQYVWERSHLVSFCLVCLKIIVYEPVAGC